MNMKSVWLIVTFVPYCMTSWVKEMENPDLYEGDIVLTPEQRKNLIQGKSPFASARRGLWPNGNVPFVISSSLQGNTKAVRAIMAAIADYHRYTCIRFTPRKNERAYVYFQVGFGCSTLVGYTGGRNRLTLGGGCWKKGIVMHELGHAVGFYHEQSRPDRDDYITIQWENVLPAYKSNFNKMPDSMIDSLGTPYDYQSMMHYGRKAFSKNRQDTIRTKLASMQEQIGQREGFSEIDKKQVNLLYSCQTA